MYRNVYSNYEMTFSVTESTFTNQTYITFLEHVIVTMSLSLKNYGTGYTYNGFYTEYYHDYDTGALSMTGWLILILNMATSKLNWLLLKGQNQPSCHIDTMTSLTQRVMIVGHSCLFTTGKRIQLAHGHLTSLFRASGYVHMSGLSMTLYGTESTPEAVSSISSHCHSSVFEAALQKDLKVVMLVIISALLPHKSVWMSVLRACIT